MTVYKALGAFPFGSAIMFMFAIGPSPAAFLPCMMPSLNQTTLVDVSGYKMVVTEIYYPCELIPYGSADGRQTDALFCRGVESVRSPPLALLGRLHGSGILYRTLTI